MDLRVPSGNERVCHSEPAQGEHALGVSFVQVRDGEAALDAIELGDEILRPEKRNSGLGGSAHSAVEAANGFYFVVGFQILRRIQCRWRVRTKLFGAADTKRFHI